MLVLHKPAVVAWLRPGAEWTAFFDAHLRYHLDMMAVLTPEQVARYVALRGYAGSPPHR